MTTALALTPNAATASVLLEVTGAPVLTAMYTQGTGVDSWSASAGTIAAGGSFGTRTGAEGWKLTQPDLGVDALASRTVTGLTAGNRYRLTVPHRTSPSEGGLGLKAGVSGIGESAFTGSASTWQQVEYTFTATATSHAVTVRAQGSRQDILYCDDITVVAISGTYAATTITRVDANGAHPVRLLVGQEPISGSMTVTDYEPALTGTLRYDLVDAAGVVTTASTALPGVTQPVLHAVTFPSLRAQLDAVTGYTGRRSVTTTPLRVIGRADPIIIGGALATREGRLEMWCPDYATALAVCNLAVDGLPLMFRQVDYPGMDMWLAVTAAEPSPAPPPGVDGLRWVAALDYVETVCPPDALQGALGWTWAALSGAFTTWAAARAAFTDWSDLLAGP